MRNFKEQHLHHTQAGDVTVRYVEDLEVIMLMSAMQKSLKLNHYNARNLVLCICKNSSESCWGKNMEQLLQHTQAADLKVRYVK